jgi:hypothetical protein
LALGLSRTQVGIMSDRSAELLGIIVLAAIIAWGSGYFW